jgi:transposase InsO family protein
MNREGEAVARCTVERLMRRLGLRGARRVKAVRATLSDKKAPCPLDKVNRQFRAERPNQLWVSDFTYVSTWQGWLYVAFIVDVFARRIVGWRVSAAMTTDVVLDALEQALHARQPERGDQLIHHSDRGSQYVSTRYSERLAEAGVEPSVGSRGDSYDNALAESTACTRPRWSIVEGHGRPGKPSSLPRSNGWTGSTTAVCSAPSAMYPRRRPRQTTTTNLPVKLPQWGMT